MLAGSVCHIVCGSTVPGFLELCEIRRGLGLRARFDRPRRPKGQIKGVDATNYDYYFNLLYSVYSFPVRPPSPVCAVRQLHRSAAFWGL